MTPHAWRNLQIGDPLGAVGRRRDRHPESFGPDLKKFHGKRVQEGSWKSKRGGALVASAKSNENNGRRPHGKRLGSLSGPYRPKPKFAGIFSVLFVF